MSLGARESWPKLVWSYGVAHNHILVSTRHPSINLVLTKDAQELVSRIKSSNRKPEVSIPNTRTPVWRNEQPPPMKEIPRRSAQQKCVIAKHEKVAPSYAFALFPAASHRCRCAQGARRTQRRSLYDFPHAAPLTMLIRPCRTHGAPPRCVRRRRTPRWSDVLHQL